MTWKTFEQALADELPQLAERAFLTVSWANVPTVYVQLEQTSTVLTVRTGEDDVLPPERRLGSAGQEALEQLARWLASWVWPMTEADSITAATEFGWTLVDEEPGKGEIFDTGLTSERSWADSRVSGGEVRELVITTARPEGGPASVTDAFAEQVQAVAGVLGAPTRRRPGASGSVVWELPNGSTLDVGRTDSSCMEREQPWFRSAPARRHGDRRVSLSAPGRLTVDVAAPARRSGATRAGSGRSSAETICRPRLDR